ncbi:hypothetical protein HKX48_008505, partial [Thoreauomyces humboldtii]
MNNQQHPSSAEPAIPFTPANYLKEACGRQETYDVAKAKKLQDIKVGVFDRVCQAFSFEMPSRGCSAISAEVEVWDVSDDLCDWLKSEITADLMALGWEDVSCYMN